MPNKSQHIYGGIVGGGKKFVCAVGTEPNNIQAEARFRTASPEETLMQVMDFFKQQEDSFGKLTLIFKHYSRTKLKTFTS